MYNRMQTLNKTHGTGFFLECLHLLISQTFHTTAEDECLSPFTKTCQWNPSWANLIHIKLWRCCSALFTIISCSFLEVLLYTPSVQHKVPRKITRQHEIQRRRASYYLIQRSTRLKTQTVLTIRAITSTNSTLNYFIYQSMKHFLVFVATYTMN